MPRLRRAKAFEIAALAAGLNHAFVVWYAGVMPPLRMLFHAVSSFVETGIRRCIGRPRRKSWPFAFEVVVGVMRRNFVYGERLPLPRARRFLDAVAASQPFTHPVDRASEQLGGVPVVRFMPHQLEPAGSLLYVHGGSYLMGSTTTHRELVARLALAGPFDARAVEYRLAPEHGIPDAVEDVCAAYRALLEEGHSPSRIVLAGDSAGGGLIFLALVALRDEGVSLPAAVAVASPWGDLACPGASLHDNEPFDWGKGELLRAQATRAAGELPLDSPRISPIHADLRQLPPTLVHVGDAEIVRDPVLAFAEALRTAGVEVDLEVWPDMVHNFHMLVGLHPAAREATEDMAAFLRRHLEASEPKVA